MAEPRTTKAIHDTRDDVVHVPGMLYYGQPLNAPPLRELENLEQFVAWLNTKAKTERFRIITVTPLISTSTRSGLGRHYATYLKGEPQVRVRAALKKIMGRRLIGVVLHGGSWEVHEASAAIRGIAEDAKVTFNEARTAYLTFLRAELGDVVDRMTFPPENAVRAIEDNSGELGEEPHPVEL